MPENKTQIRFTIELVWQCNKNTNVFTGNTNVFTGNTNVFTGNTNVFTG